TGAEVDRGQVVPGDRLLTEQQRGDRQYGVEPVTFPVCLPDRSQGVGNGGRRDLLLGAPRSRSGSSPVADGHAWRLGGNGSHARYCRKRADHAASSVHPHALPGGSHVNETAVSITATSALSE